MKQVDVVEKMADNISEELGNLYDQMAMNVLSQHNHMDEILNGKIVGYKDKTYTKYLHIPIPTISRQYDDDYEYGTGEFEGILLSVRWIRTFIPIGRETIKEPIREKLEPRTIKWARYKPITNKKTTKTPLKSIKTKPAKSRKNKKSL